MPYDRDNAIAALGRRCNDECKEARQLAPDADLPTLILPIIEKYVELGKPMGISSSEIKWFMSVLNWGSKKSPKK